MTIRHVDRTGKPWTFKVDCTPIQGRIFEQLLRTVRNVGSREELSLSYLSDMDANTAFRDELEHVVLSALRGWNGGTTATAAPPLPQPTPARVSETVNVNPSTVSDNVNTNADADGEREPYYWENF